MNWGEIWQVEFKKPDKPRPVLILTRQEMIPHLHSVTVAPITRTIRGVSSEVLVGVEEGLKEDSVVNLHHLVTLPKTHLGRFIGNVSHSKMEQVKEAMLFAFGFDET